MEDRISAIMKQRGYRIAGTLGEGAFGCVYLLQGINTEQHYACKISSGEKGTLLLREAEILKQNRCNLFPGFQAVWKEKELVILLMELIEGESGGAYLTRHGLLCADRVMDIGRQLEEGLLHLHCRGYIYRDLKPQNILICKDGRVRLVDMGCVCRIGDRNSRAGTYGFAPKEQLEGGSAKVQYDYYALGRVLLYLWTGRVDDGQKIEIVKKQGWIKKANRKLWRYIEQCMCMEERYLMQNRFLVEKDILVDDASDNMRNVE